MRHRMLSGKIHRANVTGAEVAYEGSITLDSHLMALAGILPWEAVSVWDVDNGARFQTYAIEGPADSGVVCVNGAAAHLVEVGHQVIVAAFCDLEEEEARAHHPRIVFVDERNRPMPEREECPGPDDVLTMLSRPPAD